jgi:hydroxypyruvate reductase
VTIEFDPSVLGPDPDRRARVLDWLTASLRAVEPERLTRRALARRPEAATTVLAIGKAAPAMARGAAAAQEVIDGICVADRADEVPEKVTLMRGDHPVPGEASYATGAAVLGAAAGAPPTADLVALVSGGGSALCEAPREGVPRDLLSEVNARLVSAGIGIEEVNLVRSHLSSVKGGGLSRAAGRPIPTFVISDVGGAGPGVVASGPTVPGRYDPEGALAVLERLSIEVPQTAVAAMRRRQRQIELPEIQVLADGRDAASAVASAVGGSARVAPGWIEGDVAAAVDRFLDSSGAGVTVGAGEVTIAVTGSGYGGRNTHAALLAACRLGPEDLFCAFATDGLDGGSATAGALVDGSTLARGGDPGPALHAFDSAGYLARTSDLLLCPPTGTNVSDLWILWRR